MQQRTSVEGLRLTTAFVAAVLFSATIFGHADQRSLTTARATLVNPGGQPVGTVRLTDTPAGVLLRLEAYDLPAGTHAFHIHETGKCDGPSFASAGGHFNPTHAAHGFMTEGGPHAGDMPNIHVPEGGKLEVEVLDPNVSLSPGANGLFDADGSAIVIHQTGDDYQSDPAGNAGPRISCGIIVR